MIRHRKNVTLKTSPQRSFVCVYDKSLRRDVECVVSPKVYVEASKKRKSGALKVQRIISTLHETQNQTKSAILLKNKNHFNRFKTKISELIDVSVFYNKILNIRNATQRSRTAQKSFWFYYLFPSFRKAIRVLQSNGFELTSAQFFKF